MLHRPPGKNAEDVRTRQCASHVSGQQQKPLQIFLSERNRREDIDFFQNLWNGWGNGIQGATTRLCLEGHTGEAKI